MSALDPDDDWPDVDWMDVVSTPSPALKKWLAASPRRALSKQGILLARQRHQEEPGAFVINQAPDSPEQAVWSLDVVRPGFSSRVIAPPGVAVAKVAWADDAATVTWILSPELKRTLGVDDSELTTTTPLPPLLQLPEPGGKPEQLQGFAKLLLAGGATSAKLLQLANRADSDAAKAKKKAASADAAIAKKIWSAAPRGRPVPSVIKAALAEAGLSEFEQSVATLARRVLTLTPQEGKSVPVGKARLGGAPDLPLKIGWPEIDGQLLTFVLQVPVEDTLLSLFVGDSPSTDEVEHQLLSVNPQSLQRRPVPTGAQWRDSDTGLLEPVPLAQKDGWALPPEGSDEFIALVDRHPELLERSDEYRKACELLVPSTDSHVFGFAKHPAYERDRKKQRPLLAVTSSSRAKLSFWDHGTLDVFSPTGDRFGRGVVRGTTAAIFTS